MQPQTFLPGMMVELIAEDLPGAVMGTLVEQNIFGIVINQNINDTMGVFIQIPWTARPRLHRWDN